MSARFIPATRGREARTARGRTCRWPLSMSLYRNVGGPDCEWLVPESFLNPGTSYYWRVRARDSRSAVGEWGRPDDTIFKLFCGRCLTD